MNRKKTYSGAEKEKCNIDKEVQKHNDCQCKKENKTITKKSVERTLVTFWFFFALWCLCIGVFTVYTNIYYLSLLRANVFFLYVSACVFLVFFLLHGRKIKKYKTTQWEEEERERRWRSSYFRNAMHISHCRNLIDINVFTRFAFDGGRGGGSRSAEGIWYEKNTRALNIRGHLPLVIRFICVGVFVYCCAKISWSFCRLLGHF